MAQPRALLDTDILSGMMRGQPGVLARARAYLSEHGKLSFSIITRYEILRGLKAKGATAQLAAFDRACAASETVHLTNEVVATAADIYADLRARGTPIGDADILIAASALVHGMVVVTNNQAHFDRIPGLAIDNWLRE